MLERIELSRVGTHYAAWTSDADDPVRAEAAAMAKAFVGEAANEVTGEGIQIHGGVGFTWDCDAHLLLPAGQAERPAARLPRHPSPTGRRSSSCRSRSSLVF